MIKQDGFSYGVRHLFSPESGFLDELLAQCLNFDLVKCRNLISFGAVYLDHKRVLENKLIQKNQYLRIHTTPRLFPKSLDRDWSKILHFENENYYVLDKPSGIPCHPTVDNYFENLLIQFNVWLIHQSKPAAFLTHRLDVPTSGLIVLAKSTQTQKMFNDWLTKGQLKKIYHASVQGKCPLTGRLTHYMHPSPKAPKVVEDSPFDKAQICHLEIFESKYNSLTDTTLLKIQLLTGRTHQIRVQLAYSGFPIIGDSLYQMPQSSTDTKAQTEHIALKSVYLKCPEFETALSPIQLKSENFI